MAAETLKMKVDLSDFMTAQQRLEVQVKKLEGILEEYESVKNRANQFIDDDDSRYAEMQEVINEEIKKVKIQLKLVENIKLQIDKVVDAMNEMEKSSRKVLKDSKDSVIKGVTDFIDLGGLDLN